MSQLSIFISKCFYCYCIFGALRYVHSPIGLPIPSRNGGMNFPSIKQEASFGLNSNSQSPAGGMWGCPPNHYSRTGNSVPFPVTPFNTPSQGPSSLFIGPDSTGAMKNFFLSAGNSHHQHLSSGSNPTLSVQIKEERENDLEPNLETMKVYIFTVVNLFLFSFQNLDCKHF